MFSSYVKMPAEIAAIEVHHCFNKYLLPFLQTGVASVEYLFAISASLKPDLLHTLRNMYREKPFSNCDLPHLSLICSTDMEHAQRKATIKLREGLTCCACSTYFGGL